MKFVLVFFYKFDKTARFFIILFFCLVHYQPAYTSISWISGKSTVNDGSRNSNCRLLVCLSICRLCTYEKRILSFEIMRSICWPVKQ